MVEIPPTGTIETDKVTCWVSDGILFSVAKDYIFLDIEDALEINKVFRQLTSRSLPLLVDFHTSTGQSYETREFFSKDPRNTSLLNAVALYVTNPVARVIANVYLGLASSEVPIRVFTDYESALSWLQQYKND